MTTDWNIQLGEIALETYCATEAPDIEVKSELVVAECVWLNQAKKDISEFLRDQLSKNIQPQNDCLELITLAENDDLIHFKPFRCLSSCQVNGKRNILS